MGLEAIAVVGWRPSLGYVHCASGSSRAPRRLTFLSDARCPPKTGWRALSSRGECIQLEQQSITSKRTTPNIFKTKTLARENKHFTSKASLNAAKNKAKKQAQVQKNMTRQKFRRFSPQAAQVVFGTFASFFPTRPLTLTAVAASSTCCVNLHPKTEQFFTSSGLFHLFSLVEYENKWSGWSESRPSF